MADIPRAPVFQRFKGYQPSELSPQDQVEGVPSELFPPPPGQIQLAPQRTPIQRALAWMAPFFPGIVAPIPSTDIPRAPAYTRFNPARTSAAVRAQDWVWQIAPAIPPIPSTDIIRAAHLTHYRTWNRRAAANAQAWVWQDLFPSRSNRPVLFTVV